MAADGAPHVLIWLAVGGAVQGSPDEPPTVPPSVALGLRSVRRQPYRRPLIGMSGCSAGGTSSGDVAGQSETICWQSRMTRPRPCPVTGRFPGQLRRRNCTDSGAAADCRATRQHSPVQRHDPADVSPSLPASSAQRQRARLMSPPGRRTPQCTWRFQHHEATHLMHLGSENSWCRVSGDSTGALTTWEPAAAPSTKRNGGSESGNGVSRLSGRRQRRPARTQPLRTCTVPNDGPPRRPAGGAADPSRLEDGGLSRSGALPPAGTAPGSRPGPLPPVCPR